MASFTESQVKDKAETLLDRLKTFEAKVLRKRLF